MYPRGRPPRGRGQSGWRSDPTRLTATLLPPSNSQRKIEGIDIEKIGFLSEDDMSPTVKNVELVASFNWVEAKRATILVPGCPPKWQPPTLPQSLHEDDGIYFRDANSARYPTFPTEPAVRAIFYQNAQNAFHDSDVFSCGNTLGCLLSVAKHEDRTFRFDVERVCQTLFLVRKTNTGNPRETIEEVRGYGHSFPEAYTTWDLDVKSSASHQRIIKYDFMGLKIMIRSECDGYLPDLLSQANINDLNSTSDSSTQGTDLDAALPGVSLGFDRQDLGETEDLIITPTGRTIPQHAIFDLKTRSIMTKDRVLNDMDQFYSRCWANQTRNFVLAFHRRGNFDQSDIHVKDIANEIKDWEKRNASILRRLGALLGKLIELSKTKGLGRFEISGWSALPEDLKAQLNEVQGGPEHDAGNSEELGEMRDGVKLERSSSDEDEGDDADYLKF